LRPSSGAARIRPPRCGPRLTHGQICGGFASPYRDAWAAGAMSVSPGIWLYQLTDNGLALELTAKGTKYYKDDGLN